MLAPLDSNCMNVRSIVLATCALAAAFACRAESDSPPAGSTASVESAPANAIRPLSIKEGTASLGSIAHEQEVMKSSCH